MPVTPNNIVFHELVGLHLRVHESTSADLVGVEGQVIDETMKTIVIRDVAGKRKVLLKHAQAFAFILPQGGKQVLVPGDLLAGRPWDRLKNIGKKHYTQAAK